MPVRTSARLSLNATGNSLLPRDAPQGFLGDVLVIMPFRSSAVRIPGPPVPVQSVGSHLLPAAGLHWDVPVNAGTGDGDGLLVDGDGEGLGVWLRGAEKLSE